MAVCRYCHNEMTDPATISCSRDTIVFVDGQTMAAVPYLLEDSGRSANERCHDCSVAVGGYHHPGCDMERCPRCGDRQLFLCGCVENV